MSCQYTDRKRSERSASGECDTTMNVAGVCTQREMFHLQAQAPSDPPSSLQPWSYLHMRINSIDGIYSPRKTSVLAEYTINCSLQHQKKRFITKLCAHYESRKCLKNGRLLTLSTTRSKPTCLSGMSSPVPKSACITRMPVLPSAGKLSQQRWILSNKGCALLSARHTWISGAQLVHSYLAEVNNHNITDTSAAATGCVIFYMTWCTCVIVMRSSPAVYPFRTHHKAPQENWTLLSHKSALNSASCSGVAWARAARYCRSSACASPTRQLIAPVQMAHYGTTIKHTANWPFNVHALFIPMGLRAVVCHAPSAVTCTFLSQIRHIDHLDNLKHCMQDAASSCLDVKSNGAFTMVIKGAFTTIRG